jgi:hypothetical protein
MHQYKVISSVMLLKIVDWIVDTNVLGVLQDPMLGDLILTVVCDITIGTDPQERKKSKVRVMLCAASASPQVLTLFVYIPYLLIQYTDLPIRHRC